MGRPMIDYYVLDAVADDVESVPHIRERVAHWDLPASEQLLPSLQRLTRDLLVEACVSSNTEPALVPLGAGRWPREPFEDLWFRITPHGVMVHSAWEPDAEAGPV